MSDAVRTQVLNAIVARIEGMTETTPAGDPYGISWSIVTREPLNAVPTGKRNAVGVYGGTSTRRALTTWRTVILPVVIEVYLNLSANVGQAQQMEDALAQVERCLQSEPSFGGLVTNFVVTGDQVQNDSLYANQVAGALYTEVTYFQAETDPRKARS